MEERIKSLEDKISNMDSKLNKIINLLENDVSKNCKKMNTHIDFIENVYENVKHPLNFVCSQFNYLEDTNNSIENEKK
jgi:hypothetical protein